VTELNYDLLGGADDNDIGYADDGDSEILVSEREEPLYGQEFALNEDFFDEGVSYSADAAAVETEAVTDDVLQAEAVVEPESALEKDDGHEKVEKKTAASKTHKVFKLLFALALLFLAAELIWLFVITPLRPFNAVTINGIDFSLIEKDYVLRKAGINDRSSFLFFDENAAKIKLLEIPLIEDAKVEKHFPGTITLNLSQRKPVALFLINANGKSMPAFFDRHGVVFMAGNEERFKSLPVISGLETANISLGQRLSSVYIPLFENLDNLSKKAPELLEAISEIEINKKAYDGFDVTLFPSHSPVRIRMNKNLDEDTIRYMFLVLDVLEAKNEVVSEIDFRMGTASYFIK
jgi:cell division protein FtsQ